MHATRRPHPLVPRLPSHPCPRSPTHRYRTVPLPFIQNELAFEGAAAAREFLVEHRVGFFQNPNAKDEEAVFDCKPASALLAQIYEEKYRKVQIKGAV